ncbi:MAG: allophanate hydrolase subunit 1 [Actinomycetota bacterium]
MRLLACGDKAILVELEDAGERRRLDEALRRHPVRGVLEHVPAARTVLVRAVIADQVPAIALRLREIRLDGPATVSTTPDAAPVQIRTHYDGPDLEEVSRQLEIPPAEVVARHTGQLWTVEFAGFAPGFGYLTGEHGGLEVARRDSPRVRIPPGSVALAGPYSAVYPGPSPGGWQLIGHTDEVMWDVTRDPPALLSPGTRVQFVEVT